MAAMRITICATAVLFAAGVLLAQNTNPEPTCTMCPATYIDKSEIDAYVKKAMAEKLTDQQVRDVEIGKAHVVGSGRYEGSLASFADLWREAREQLLQKTAKKHKAETLLAA